jgi:hypothetical protein
MKKNITRFEDLRLNGLRFSLEFGFFIDVSPLNAVNQFIPFTGFIKNSDPLETAMRIINWGGTKKNKWYCSINFHRLLLNNKLKLDGIIDSIILYPLRNYVTINFVGYESASISINVNSMKQISTGSPDEFIDPRKYLAK